MISSANTETGGEGGQEAAIRLKQIFGRVESPWRPADPEEGFEIVRRRLFEPIPVPTLCRTRCHCPFVLRILPYTTAGISRSSVVRPIMSDVSREGYPIHPELFDRLFTDWSSIAKFQRTRGVLRSDGRCYARIMGAAR